MKKILLLLSLYLNIQVCVGQSITILPGNSNSGNILSNSGSYPSTVLFPSGTTNPNKMAISHSPNYPTYGLQYRDVGDKFVFMGGSIPVLTSDLNLGTVGVGIDNPVHQLDVLGGSWNLATSNQGDFRIGNGTYNFRIGVATGGGGAGDVRMFTFGGTNRFIWGTNGLDRMALTSAGELGLGTIAPSSKLHVKDGDIFIDSANPRLLIKNNANTLYSGIKGISSIGNDEYWFGYTETDDILHIHNYNGPYSTLHGIFINNANNVGIGVNAPEAKLHINHSGSDSNPHIRVNATGAESRINWTTNTNTNKWVAQSYLNSATAADNYWRIEYNSTAMFNIKGDGDVGINTNSPTAKLHILGYENNGTTAALKITSGVQNMLLDGNEIDAFADALNLNHNTTQNVILANGGGNVGIGTTSPNNKLDVLGIIRANEVIVETGWADYVFEEDYKLESLEKVESFIKENKHLPNVPSAKEVQEKGAHVAELMTSMMAKIEELTLHAIKQQKEIDDLKKILTNKAFEKNEK
jgi:hypothetical protein